MCSSESQPPRVAWVVSGESPVDVSLHATPLRECWACVGDGALDACHSRIPEGKSQDRFVIKACEVHTRPER